MTKLKTWVLTDHRVGNSNQARSLAKILGLDYEEKFLTYSKLGGMSNFFPLPLSLRLSRVSLASLKAPYPEVIISAGRRTGKIAALLKQKDPKIRVIQIMRPELAYDRFDVVLLPSHDRSETYKEPNIIYTLGGISYFTPEELNQVAEEWRETIALPKDKKALVVLIGNIDEAAAIRFLGYAAETARLNDAALLVSTSRRTSAETREAVSLTLDDLKGIWHHHYDYHNDAGARNPYKAMLGLAYCAVVTSDSVSMCSDIIAANKPLYIYGEPKKSSHQKYIRLLYSEQRASPFTGVINFADISTPEPSTEPEMLRKKLGKIAF
jgi:mitochondrial fission protein ELM1